MSIEPEDLLEEALRRDLPTSDAEARVRRRLLAAGLAVGNGVVTTSAAAGVTAVKMAGLSWGLKLGLAAAVAIPTVGLLLDSRVQPAAGVPATHTTPARSLDAQSSKAPAPTPPVADPTEPETAPVPQMAGRTPPRATRAPAADVAPIAARPSQADFNAAEPASRSERVSSLAEETRLLDGAFVELTAGNLARASILIREHETRFPTGLLQRERERAKARLSELSRGE